MNGIERDERQRPEEIVMRPAVLIVREGSRGNRLTGEPRMDQIEHVAR
jgi:hypothetical protein